MLLVSSPVSALKSLPPLNNSSDSLFTPSMPAAKRPKLSLQTSALPSAHYGTAGSNTGNARVADMTAATPTTLNTFNNTFDLSIRPSPVSATATPSILSKAPTRVPSISRSCKRQLPYELNLPLGKRSILKNSSLPHDVRRGSLGTIASCSPLSASTGRKAFFPEPKRVKFGGEEEVINKIYLQQHIDISSSEDEGSSNSETGSDDGVALDQHNNAEATKPAGTLSIKTAANIDEVQRGRNASKGTSSPSPHRTRKTRKRRRWEWTLSNESGSSPEIENTPMDSIQQTEQDHSDATSSAASTPSVATPADITDEKKDTVDITVDEVVPTPTSADREAAPTPL